MEENNVNLFVVGAMKAGTTSFIDMLSQHSQIYVSPVKEPHYFVNSLPENLYEPSRFFSLEEYLKKKFPEPLHITKVESSQQYSKIYVLAGKELYKVDGSTAYLHAPESAKLIYDYNPEAKIIIILRNPLQRAYSHYKMNLGKGRTKQSFENEIQQDIEAYQNGIQAWYSYLGMSLYKAAVDRYKQLFTNVLVIRFEDLILKEQEVLSEVSAFLNINSFPDRQYAHKNTGKELRFQKLFYFLKKLGLKDYFSKIFSSNFRQFLFKIFSKRKAKNLELSSTIKTKLEDIFTKESNV
ncbi:sulfotransferase family protein [Ulvibacter sp. MAR_2010_11]|uniref:sulfotransferase family protein n=1 Tax=Ulvibacter sp. MAR_2010_11 TaxID=1250229 RepID=UPI000C2C178E|nr:sulfotransferase [Ulvibacter sp. MAR_2010_11]PKA84358.1 sulfotransferase family protein [Ulvibacter sp. MAR_2010_11]